MTPEQKLETGFSAHTRSQLVVKMQQEQLDVLVIGGGITGAGILLDGVTRGLTMGLVEMQDFAAGTSSRSTKLVHGGLRHLKRLQVGLVAEVGRERAIVHENAPHVTTPVRMLLPIMEDSRYGMLASNIGLSLYDRLARVRKNERRQMLSKKEALQKEPLLRQDDLKGAGYYVEYRTDDARLTIEVIKEAVQRGAFALNYTEALELHYEHGKVAGVNLVDGVSGRRYLVRAQKVINATGPWVDELRGADESHLGRTMHLTKGVHIVVSQNRFPLKNAVYFDVPDGRMVFAIPRGSKTYVGTTDTDYHGDVVEPRTTASDRDYLINCVNRIFPSVQLTACDVESFWAGVRPLIHEEGKEPSEISRRDEVSVSQSGLITIAGGRLSGYRKMAEKVMNLVVSQLRAETGAAFGRCQTERIHVSGGKFGGSYEMERYIAIQTIQGATLGLTQREAATLSRRYGTKVTILWDILSEAIQENGMENDFGGAGEFGGQGEIAGLSNAVYASLVYSITREMVVTPSDFFMRRTGALFFDIDFVRKWKEPVIRFMAETCGWSYQQTSHYREKLEQHIAEATEVVEDGDAG